MLQPKRLPVPESHGAPYDEALARLAGVRHALRLVDDWGGGPAGDCEPWDTQDDLVAHLTQASEAQRRAFDRETARTVSATAAGLDAIRGEQKARRTPHAEASRLLVEEIRRELSEVSRIVLR